VRERRGERERRKERRRRDPLSRRELITGFHRPVSATHAYPIPPAQINSEGQGDEGSRAAM